MLTRDPANASYRHALQSVDPASWRSEVIEHEELFIDVHSHLPPEMVYERELLICRL